MGGRTSAGTSDTVLKGRGGGSSGWRADLRVALGLPPARRPQRPEERLLFPDAGATARAKRDAPEQAAQLLGLGDLLRLQQADGGSDGLVLLAAPTPADYEEVDNLCALHRGPLVTLNGRLADDAIGIGTVARERRQGLLAGMLAGCGLIPTADGALRRGFPVA